MAIPVSSFTASNISGAPGLTATFTDTSTNTPTSWAWNFGDGTSSSSQNPSHSFSSEGIYSVTLTTSNASGSNTFVSTQLIHVSALNSAPIAAFRVTQTFGISGVTSIQFMDTSRYVPSSWLWDFGDGTGSRAQFPTHVYAVAGTYDVTLTVTNRYGSNAFTISSLITIDDQLTGIAMKTISSVAVSANPATSFSVSWPSNSAGDGAYLIVASTATVSTPTNWNYISQSSIGTTKLYVFYQYVLYVQSGSITITTASGVSRAVIVTYSGHVPHYPPASANGASTAGTALATYSYTHGTYTILAATTDVSSQAMLTAETSAAGVNWVPTEELDSVTANYPGLMIVDGPTTNNSTGTVSATLTTSGTWNEVDIHPKRHATTVGLYSTTISYWNSLFGYTWSSWEIVSGFAAQSSAATGFMYPAHSGAAYTVARADLVTMGPQSDTSVYAQIYGSYASQEQYVMMGINATPSLNTSGYSPSEIYVKLSYNATAANSSISLWQGSTQLGSSVTKSLAGTSTYSIRLIRLNGQLYTKVWLATSVEPTSWDISAALPAAANGQPQIGVPSMSVISGSSGFLTTFYLPVHEVRAPITLETWSGTNGSPWPLQWTVDTPSATIQSNSGSITSPAVAAAASHAMLLAKPVSMIDMYVTVTGTASGIVQTVIIGTGSPSDFNSASEWLSGANVRLNYAATASSSTISLYSRDASLTTAVTMTLTGTTAYRVRFQVATVLSSYYARAKVWAVTAAEPSTWTISASYTMYAANQNSSIGYPAIAVSSGTSSAVQFTFNDLLITGDYSTSTVKIVLPYTAFFNGTANAVWPGHWTKVLGLDGTSTSGTGVMTTPALLGAATRYDLSSIPDMGNIMVQTRFNMTSYTTAAYARLNINGNAGGSYRSPNDCYYVELQYGSNQICLGKVNGGIDSPWSAVSKTLTTGTVYGIRIQRVWQTLRVRVWDYSGSEPTTWDDVRTISGLPVNGTVSLSIANTTTDAATGAFYSATVSNPAVGKLKGYVSGTFSAVPLKVWNGTVWEQKPVKQWDGTNWNLTNY